MAFAAIDLMPMAVSRYRALYPEVEVNLRYIRTQGQKLALTQARDRRRLHDRPVRARRLPQPHADQGSALCGDAAQPPADEPSEIRPGDLAGEDLILGDMAEWEAYRWRLMTCSRPKACAMKVQARGVQYAGAARPGRGRPRRHGLSEEPGAVSGTEHRSAADRASGFHGGNHAGVESHQPARNSCGASSTSRRSPKGSRRVVRALLRRLAPAHVVERHHADMLLHP